MLRCQDVAGLTTDYLEQALPWWMRLQIRMHVIACRHCRRYVRQVRELVAFLARLPSEPPPPGTEDLLKRKLKEGKHDRG